MFYHNPINVEAHKHGCHTNSNPSIPGLVVGVPTLQLNHEIRPEHLSPWFSLEIPRISSKSPTTESDNKSNCFFSYMSFYDQNLINQCKTQIKGSKSHSQIRDYKSLISGLTVQYISVVVSPERKEKRVVNFTNILWAHLRQYSSAKKSSNLQCKHKKASRKVFVWKSRA